MTCVKKTRKCKIFDRDGNKCINCGSTVDLTIDHIIPKCAGGTNAIDNLQTLCLRCNSIKGHRNINKGNPITMQFGSVSILKQNFLIS